MHCQLRVPVSTLTSVSTYCTRTVLGAVRFGMPNIRSAKSVLVFTIHTTQVPESPYLCKLRVLTLRVSSYAYLHNAALLVFTSAESFNFFMLASIFVIVRVLPLRDKAYLLYAITPVIAPRAAEKSADVVSRCMLRVGRCILRVFTLRDSYERCGQFPAVFLYITRISTMLLLAVYERCII